MYVCILNIDTPKPTDEFSSNLSSPSLHHPLETQPTINSKSWKTRGQDRQGNARKGRQSEDITAYILEVNTSVGTKISQINILVEHHTNKFCSYPEKIVTFSIPTRPKRLMNASNGKTLPAWYDTSFPRSRNPS